MKKTMSFLLALALLVSAAPRARAVSALPDAGVPEL